VRDQQSILPGNRARVGRRSAGESSARRPTLQRLPKQRSGIWGLLVFIFSLLVLGGQAFASDRILISESGGSTTVSEAGPTSDSFTIRLDTAPSATIYMTVTPDSQIDIGNGAGNPVQFSFNGTTYSTPYTITVTAVNDNVAEGPHTGQILVEAEGGDSGYTGLLKIVTVYITDNDTAGVVITQSGGSTNVNEAGTTSDTYTIHLNSQPTSDVTVTITPDSQVNLGSGAGVAITMTFTTANWNTNQTVTVTAVNDNLAEGAHTATITHQASSLDPIYNGISIDSVTANVTDDETAGVTITESGGSTDIVEGGATDTYTVKLNTQPTADVTVSLVLDGQASVDLPTLTFTTANWNTNQTVTVTATNDNIAEGLHHVTIRHLVSSTDPAYNGISIADVTAAITDNDSAGVTINQSAGTTDVSEQGPTSDSYTIMLNSCPTSNVYITVDPDDQTSVGAGTGVPITLTFTPGNYGIPQTVTVTGVDDGVAEGPHTSRIIHQVSSLDTVYNGLSVPDLLVNVTEDDKAGVVITESGGATNVNESGTTTDTYTVVLTTVPATDVIIRITPDSKLNVGAGLGTSLDLTFTPLNWNVTQTVTVTPQNDSIAQGAHIRTITHQAISTDPYYNGVAVRDVNVNVTDNDTLGVTIAESGGSTCVNEQGETTDTYTVRLNTQPTASVTVSFVTDGQTTVSPTSLTFTTTNWNSPQTVTVTAVDDGAAEGFHTSTITHSVSSTDTNYSGFAVRSVIVQVTDNDTAGVTITETDSSTDIVEGGVMDTYDVVLNTQPTAPVTITLTTDNQVSVNPSTLTFTTANWNSPQTVTVTAVNDLNAEGVHHSTIRHQASSTDTNYNGIDIAVVTAAITDNDSAGVTIVQSGGSTQIVEGGATDTYTVVLNTQPTAPVTITVMSDNQSTVSAGTLTFTTANWNDAQTVTVTAVDDVEAEGVHFSTITHSVSSTDPVYSGIFIPSVTAKVTDNDIAGVTITESGGSMDVNEAGATSDTYTIVLNTPPAGNVTVAIISDGQTTVSPSTLTFTPGNWNSAQTVTVTAVDDSAAEGAHTSTLSHFISSADSHYNGIAVRSVNVHITDNDLAGVTITESGGSIDVNEAGPTSDTYTIVLNTPPTANVTISITPDVSTTVSTGTVIFTTVNWNIPQTITVTAVDDDMAEGAHDSTIVHTASSTDPRYSGVTIRNVIAHVTDNDSVGVTIAETGGSTDVDEQGPTSDSYTLVLNTQPTGNVTITVNPDIQTDLGSGPGVAITRTFTTADWNVPQTVTVTAVDDAFPESVHTSTIIHTAASTDMNYSGVAIRNVTVHVTDNDAVGVTITESGGSTHVNETGPTSDSYTIVLNTQPTALVTITVVPDGQTDLGSGAGVARTLTFTIADWNMPQTVTVTAVDDDQAEGYHASTIVHSAASTDSNYNGLSIRSIPVGITDNDTAGVTITESGGSSEVNEQGPTTDTYTVVLNTQPTSDVTVTITPDNQATVSTSVLTFTTVNWATPQTVTVTAVDDDRAEGSHYSTISHSVASTDTNYNSLAVASVSVHVTDNDTVGVTITESGGSTEIDESGPTSDTYDVVLNTQPTGNVSITVLPDTQSTVSPATLIFTPTNWNVPQTVTVTAVDDLDAEGAHISTIMHYAASTDTTYSGIGIRNVFVHVTDDDIAGVTIAQSMGDTRVSEEGPTFDTYTVVLNTPPTSASVTITVDPDNQVDLGAGFGNPIMLTFTAANWNVPQEVTVTAVDDAVAEGPHTSIITHTSASTDPHYNAIVIKNVTVSLDDNDSAAVVISEPNGSTIVNEAGPTSDTYTIVLSIAPTSNVTITVDPDTQTDVGAGMGAPITLTFTTANWHIPQTVTVTAVNDTAAEGAHTSTIAHTAMSSDPNYNGISIRSVTVGVIDDDTAGVLITQNGGSTDVDETGPTSDTYTIQLTIPPTSNVTITIKPDIQVDVGAGANNPITMVFTTANWNIPQTVIVTAVDDQRAEGAFHTGTITHSASSSDTNYNGITIASVAVTVADNDTAGVSIGETGGSSVSEVGPTSDSYTIVLDTPPTANVTIRIEPDVQTDVGGGAGASKTIQFSPTNWNIPQVVTITAVVDGIAEGLHQSTIRHSSSSSDSTYNGIAVRPVIVKVIDADIAGITIVESGDATEVNEQGPSSDSYTLVLNTPPTANVIVTIDPDKQTDVGAGADQPRTLTFTSANWNSPQTVTVTAVDDPYAEGPHNSTIAHIVASADTVYNGLTVRNVTVGVTDNDVAGITITESDGVTEVSEEGPGSDVYTIVLNTPPTGDVIVLIDPDRQTDLGEGAGVPVTVRFTPGNWNVPQVINVTAVDDGLAEGVHSSIITHVLTSTDRCYNGLTRNITVSVADNDVAGVEIVESGGGTYVNEQGTTTDTYTLVLNTPSTSDVTITAKPDVQTDLGAGAGASVTLIFTKTNWNIPQRITVKAVDDRFAEGDHTSTIIHRASSADRGFNGIAIRDVIVNLTDNDLAGITVSETNGSTSVSEDGASDSYTIVLNTPPKSDVTVSVRPDKQVDVGNGGGAVGTLVFTPGNWDVPQTVNVKAVDDPYAEGLHGSTITHAVQSADPAYNEITVRSVTPEVSDNDTKGVSVIETNGSTDVDENGMTDTYSIVLNTQITTILKVTVVPDYDVDLGAGPGRSIVLFFTPADWNIPQTVTVQAVDDAIREGLHESVIKHRISTYDGSYIFATADDVVVHIVDNEDPPAGLCASGGLLMIAGVVLMSLMITGLYSQKD